MTMMSVPSTTSRFRGEASSSMGKHLAGRRLAKRSSCLRRPRSPRSGLCSCGRSSHLGPPTAPKRIASAFRQSASVAGGSGAPVASMAPPPTSPSSKSKVVPEPFPTARSTRTASGVTSPPIPSPGSTAILWLMAWASHSPGFLGALAGGQHPVERAQVGARARLDDVGRGALAGDQRAVEVHLYRHLAQRVLAGRGGADRVILEPPLHAGDGVDGGQRRVHRAVADPRVLVRLALLLELVRRRRDHSGSADDVQVLELVHRLRLRGLVGDDGDEILVEDFLLPVGEVLEPLEGPVEIAARHGEAQLLEAGRERGAAGVLAEDELVRRPPDVLGLHDLVGELLFQDAVLVDARLVGEGVLADDGLVRLDVDARDVGEEPRGAEDLLGLDTGLHPEEVLAGAERHDDLLEGGVARPLADTVDGALDLTRAV